MIQRIANNFYLRNFLALLIYISPNVLQDIAKIDQTGSLSMVKDVLGHAAFFLFFIFHSRILYEKLFFNKKYGLYAISFIVTILMWRESSSYFIWLATRPPGEVVYQIDELKTNNWAFWLFCYWADLVYSWIALGVYLSFKYFTERARLLEIENVQKELELKQLNEQLNPHFLFNALNNIYSHTIRETGSTKELILKLSELMRYILDSSKKKTVPLNDELGFIEHYIVFEEERLGKRCMINYSKSVTTTNFNIVPLILFNFIENAFKHGTNSIYRSDIRIEVRTDEESLNLIISNPIFNNNNNGNHSTKTGLDNVQRRLALLYPKAHKLEICQDKDIFTVMLELQNR